MRLSLVDLLATLVDSQRSHSWWGMLRFLLAGLVFGWLVNGTWDVVGHWGDPGGNGPPLAGLGAAALCFLALFLWVTVDASRQHYQPVVRAQAPGPHRGLIVMLSTYPSRERPDPAKMAELRANLERLEVSASPIREAGEFRQGVFGTNWGPFYAAVEYHKDSLRHCWIICTRGEKGSANQFDAAAKVVHLLAGEKCKTESVGIDDPNDIAETTRVVEDIYGRLARDAGLGPREIIADFTGGTAAMSGGMVVATLHWDRHLEYLSQHRRLVDQETGQALTPEDIVRERVLVGVETSPVLLSGLFAPRPPESQ